MESIFCIRFSGITIRFRLPAGAEYEPWKDTLACPAELCPDAEYRVELLETPLAAAGEPIYQTNDITEYSTDEGRLRIFNPLTEKDGCQVACLLRYDNRNILYYPAKRWDFYAHPFHCLALLMPEHLLLRQNAFLLHSSVIAYRGKTVLFSGPSGAGKSTQAALWQKYTGAALLNGDRCVVMRMEDGFYGGGSPWAGTSGIYCSGQYPAAGIVLLEKSTDNRITRLGADAFSPLFAQTVVNSWDRAFMESITTLFSDLLARVPVYRLHCRPDEEAVQLVHQTLFGKETACEQ